MQAFVPDPIRRREYRTWSWVSPELAGRRFSAYLCLILACLFLTFLLGLVDPQLGTDLAKPGDEGPVDASTQWIFLAGAIGSTVVLAIQLARRGRPDWFWVAFALLLTLGAIEESHSMAIIPGSKGLCFLCGEARQTIGRPLHLNGVSLRNLHDIPHLWLRQREPGPSVFVPFWLLVSVVAGGTIVLILAMARLIRSSPLLDTRLVLLLLLAVVLGGLAEAFDSLLPDDPVGFSWLSYLEECFEAIGSLSLVFVAFEGLIRALTGWPGLQRQGSSRNGL